MGSFMYLTARSPINWFEIALISSKIFKKRKMSESGSDRNHLVKVFKQFNALIQSNRKFK